ncbi:hypothetical protein [uncultured Ruminococcus sp.]|nr:hypothetical protein [uncultured Ruminococcus sp.]
METTRPQSRKSLWVSGGWYLLAALPVVQFANLHAAQPSFPS